MTQPSLPDNFSFALFGANTKAPFRGYISSIDPTVVGVGALIGGAHNCYKRISEDIYIRPGLKRRGTANSTLAGVVSNEDFYMSNGQLRVLRVVKDTMTGLSKLQVESDLADGSTLVWYDLMIDQTNGRYVFDTWWNAATQESVLVFVHGGPDLDSWTGGIEKISATSNATGLVSNAALNAVGSSYTVGDILTIDGGTGATIKVLTIGSSGHITSFQELTAGTGYSSGTGANVTGGTGTGATFDLQVMNNSITFANSPAANGFSATGGTVTINGNTYIYDTIVGDQMVGINNDPTGEPVGSVAVAGVVINDPAELANNSNDFLKVVANQVNIGSYTSQFIYVSSNTSFTDYTVPEVRAPGDPDLLVLGSLGRGITIQKGSTDRSGNAVISGGIGDWYTIVRTSVTVGDTLTEQVDVIQTQTADLSGALAHEFIDLIGDTIIYLDQNNQLRQFGLIRNIVSPVFPLLSLDVFTELKGRNFTGGAMRVIEDEGDTTVYITCPAEGIDYMYQVREHLDSVGNVQTERLWQPPQIRGISRLSIIDGVVYGYSATNPQMFQLWDTDQYYDDGPDDGDQIPYACHMIFGYMALGRTLQMDFDKLYFEGHMTRGSEVYCSTYLEYQGSKNILTTTINKPTLPNKKLAQFFGAVYCPVPGESILGNIEIGDGILPPQNLSTPVPKFRAMRRIQVANVFEAAIDVWSESLDAQWGLLLVGANLQAAKNQPTGIMGIPGLLS